MNTKSIILILYLVSVPLLATIINVPGTQPTIQDGIDAASDGDTVLVAPGVYYENINYRKKGIVVASNYLVNDDPVYIDSTIINGSTPVHPDTASCVLIVSDTSATMSDTGAALIGFTITKGTGTKWLDEHGVGLFREGGGILIQYLSPRIVHNIIVDNEAVDAQGCVSAGGGAIRCGDGDPRILNNIIAGNKGIYGGGIVLNFTGAVIKNNIIANDSAGGAYGGGGGIWAYANSSAPKIIENNTIVNNVPGGSATGGGLRLWSASAEIRNNIIWANDQQQLTISGGTVTVTYCDVQNGWTGEGNIDSEPYFESGDYYLSDTSPCIDAGDTAVAYNDPEDPYNPGYALWPAKGTLRNDMGCFGGPGSAELGIVPGVAEKHLDSERSHGLLLDVYPNPFCRKTTIRYADPACNGIMNHLLLQIYNSTGQLIKQYDGSYLNHKSSILWNGTDQYGNKLSSGVYVCLFKTADGTASRKLLLLNR